MAALFDANLRLQVLRRSRCTVELAGRRGKTALEKNLIEYFKNPDQPTTKDAVQQIRFIKPDVAIVIVKRTYRRPTDTRRSIATYVMQRIGSDWQIAAFQNTFVQ